MPRRRHSELIDGEADVNRVGGWSRKRIVRMSRRCGRRTRRLKVGELGKDNRGSPNPLCGDKERPRRCDAAGGHLRLTFLRASL
jgi:hypothetical protein